MTADQQIYQVTVDILFASPDLSSKAIAIFGLMHFEIDFVSCIGTLMTDSSLKAIICRAFRSVKKLLEGKNYPQNVCALRIFTEVLRQVIELSLIHI